MPDEEKTGLDAMLTAEDAEIAKLAEGTPLGAPKAEEPETPPAEPPKEPEPTPEPERKEPPTETPPKEVRSPTWKQIKDLDRMRKALEAENERLKQELNARTLPVDQDLDLDGTKVVDPLEEMDKKLKEQDQKIAQTTKALEDKAIFDEIVRQEQAYTKEHPDYEEALKYLVEQAKTEWTYDGSLTKAAKVMIARNRDQLEDFAIQNGFINDETGEPKLMEAGKEAAFRAKVWARRQEMVENWRSEGLNIADEAYKFAKARGFAGRVAAAPAPETKPEEPASRERVIRAKENEAASSSLSALSTTGTKRPDEIRKRSQILDMNPDEQAQYIDKMDKENPGWFNDLPD